MMPRVPVRLRLAPIALALLALGTCVAPARAQSGDTCVAAYEGAQELRQRGSLVQARRELDVCRAACPAALARDCEAWQRDVASRVGRVRLVVTRGGSPATPDAVLVDGRPAVIEPDGGVLVDPGDHTLRIDVADARATERAVSVAPGTEVALTIDVPSHQEDEAPGMPPTSALIVGGVGAGALLVGGGLAIAGHLRVGDLRDDCAPDCAESDVDAVRALWIAGGVAAGVGVGALAVAVALTLGGSSDGGAATRTGLVLAAPPPGAPLGLGARGTF